VDCPGYKSSPSTNHPTKPPLTTPPENNPTVLTPLAHGLGLPTTYTFHDVYALTPDLLAFIPRPAHALIALIPSAVWRRTRLTELDAGSASVTAAGATGSPDGRHPLWFKQTIGNACGLYALLHALGNGAVVPALLAGGGEAARLVRAAHALDSVEERAEVLEASAELERLHGEAALRGDTVAPSPEYEPGHHFMCFVKGVDGRLWEMEGAWRGPIELGQLGEEEDVLSEKALELGVKRFMKHANEGEVNFSLTALAPTMD
jgi:hypothetical protein